MAAGFRDILALLLGWQSAHRFWQTEGPYRLAAGGTFHAGPVAAIASGGNVIAGQCNG